MPKALKWILGIVAGLIILIILAVLIAPKVIDLDRYKPQIENQAAKALGRPVRLGGKLEPSIFPWVGVAISDVHIGNPSGFENQDFVSVNSFEVRVKLLPLLSREVEVQRLVVKSPEIILEKQKNGRTNWEGLGSGEKTAPRPDAKPEPPGGAGLPIKTLQVGEFSINDGRVVYIDQAAGTRQEIRDFNLSVNDFTLERPFDIRMNAVADGRPIALDGKIGPLGSEPGKQPLPLDLHLALLEMIDARLKGQIDASGSSPRMALNFSMEPFSPRRLLDELKQPLPFKPADDAVLQKMALSMKIEGTPENVTLSEGALQLDDSRMTFSARAQDFSKPDLKLKADLDAIDVDRYLPPPAPPAEGPAETGRPPATPAAKPDFTPLRKLLLDAEIKIGKLKAKNARLQNVALKATARNGIIRIDPQTELYSGRLAGTSVLNVQQDEPRSSASLKLSGVQAEPLVKDLLEKEIIAGTLTSDLNLTFSGIEAQTIRRTLNGEGLLTFKDGAIVGIDLANMVRNAQAAFGLAERPTEKPRTDFSELLLPFAVSDGLTRINDAQLNSPLLRVTTNGTANLVEETLDLRVSPKFVATLVGQSDTQQRSGVMVPVMVQGSLSDPKFRPDLKAALQQELPGDLEQKKQEAQKQIESKKEELRENVQKKAQELFKGLPFGSPQQQPKP